MWRKITHQNPAESRDDNLKNQSNPNARPFLSSLTVFDSQRGRPTCSSPEPFSNLLIESCVCFSAVSSDMKLAEIGCTEYKPTIFTIPVCFLRRFEFVFTLTSDWDNRISAP